MSDAIERFSGVRWTDFALEEISTERQEAVDDLILTMAGLYAEQGKRFELRFKDATYVRMEIDLAFKRVTSDGIDGGRCLTDSLWKRTLSDKNPHDDFSSYFHFQIGLVPKSGVVDVLAKDFSFDSLKVE